MSYLNKILIAHPNLNEPMFKRSVIYVYEKNSHGYCGVIVNKPGPADLGEICHIKGYEAYNNYDEPVRIGGPVSRQALLMLHSNEWCCDTTNPISANLSITSDEIMLHKITNGEEPYNWRLINGISAWVGDQLDREVKGVHPFSKETSWLVLDMDLDFLFSYDDEEQWEVGIEIASNQMVEQYF